jgi:YfiR/HmsC-like
MKAANLTRVSADKAWAAGVHGIPVLNAMNRVRIFLAILLAALPAWSDDLPEFRLKAAFLYNFALFTEWPTEEGSTLNLCILGPDPFGTELDVLQGKAVGNRSLAIQHKRNGESVAACQMVFVTAAAIASLPRVLDAVKGHPVLVVADSAGAARQGAALNLAVDGNKVSFEANLQAARAAGINLRPKLLRLATEVIQ